MSALTPTAVRLAGSCSAMFAAIVAGFVRADQVEA